MKYKIRWGDVAVVKTKLGNIFFQLIGPVHNLGELVAIYPKPYNDVSSLASAINNEDYFFVFYMFSVMVQEERINIVDNFVPPLAPHQHRIKRDILGLLSAPNEWIIRDNLNWKNYYYSEKLTENEKRIPEGIIYSHKSLLTKIEQGWRPDQIDKVDIYRFSNPQKFTPDTMYYLYFDSMCDELIEKLTDNGFMFDIVVEKSSILVKVWRKDLKHMDSDEPFLIDLSDEFGGSYDGNVRNLG